MFQVLGRKKWRIFVPNNEALAELENRMPKGSKTPEGIWECILEQGDALYIPKGWRHEAIPLGGETIHLTAGIERRSGWDYLSWILSNSKKLSVLQEAIPRFSDKNLRLEHQNKLKEAMIDLIDSFPLDTYFDVCNTELRVRGQINLPWSACKTHSLDTDTTINWLLPFVTDASEGKEKETYCVKAGGQKLEFHFSLLPVLKQLELVRNTSYGKLCAFAKNYDVRESELFDLPAENVLWHKAFYAATGLHDMRYICEPFFYNRVETRLSLRSRIGKYSDKNFYERMQLSSHPKVLARLIGGRLTFPDFSKMSVEQLLSHKQTTKSW